MHAFYTDVIVPRSPRRRSFWQHRGVGVQPCLADRASEAAKDLSLCWGRTLKQGKDLVAVRGEHNLVEGALRTIREVQGTSIRDLTSRKKSTDNLR